MIVARTVVNSPLGQKLALAAALGNPAARTALADLLREAGKLDMDVAVTARGAAQYLRTVAGAEDKRQLAAANSPLGLLRRAVNATGAIQNLAGIPGFFGP